MGSFMVDEIKLALTEAFPQSQIEVKDLSGGGDHLEVIIESPAFEGKSLIQQHQMVYAVVGHWINAPVHALKINTRVKRDL
jgi:stress-induced morphogen